jgi:hypothetical protein
MGVVDSTRLPNKNMNPNYYEPYMDNGGSVETDIEKQRAIY